jgi:pyrrolysine biosynthesis protein PylD
MILSDLDNYEEDLKSKTGLSLTGIAARAAGLGEDDVQNGPESALVGVVPVTAGRGRISGFCGCLAGILSHLRFQSFVTAYTDAAGLAEAFEKQADVIMMADDVRFVAIHTPSRQVIDNAAATAEGFVTGLSLMAGGLEGRNVLVLGCGRVGGHAAEALLMMNARVSLYDIDPDRCRTLFKMLSRTPDMRIAGSVAIFDNFDRAMAEHQYIIDTTPAEGIIRLHHLTPDTWISAPGVPCGLCPDARSKIAGRLLHDPLQIGVATMAFLALACRRQLKGS